MPGFGLELPPGAECGDGAHSALNVGRGQGGPAAETVADQAELVEVKLDIARM